MRQALIGPDLSPGQEERARGALLFPRAIPDGPRGVPAYMNVRGLLLVVGMGAILACGCGAWRPGASANGGNCSQTPATGGPPYTRAPGPPGSTGGSAAVTPGQAPRPGPPSSSPPAPVPAGGRVVVTAANSRQTVTVPRGTVVEVRLEPTGGVRWNPPESSDRSALPRLGASGPCGPVQVATFRADGAGQISAERPHGDAVEEFVVTVQEFVVTVQVTPLVRSP